MKKEALLLKKKAISSLLLSIDHFNSLVDMGRADAVLMFIDHSFEMLLKSSILWRGGKIRDPGNQNTIGFDACVRRALTTEGIKFLTSEQALALQAINGLRDAAQHYLLQLSEGQLYIHAQSGVTLFRDILREVFNEDILNLLPERALPISTVVPSDPITLFTSELEEVRQLLAPGKRKRTEAEARLRGLAILDSSLQGEESQPGTLYLRKLGKEITGGKSFEDIFPGIAAVDFETGGSGAKISLRITKKEGIPVHLVHEGTPEAKVVAIKRVDDLSYYSLGHNQVAQKVGLTPNKTSAAIYVLKLKNNPDCYKQYVVGKSKFNRYSPAAVSKIKELLKRKTAEEIWVEYKSHLSKVGGSPKG